jgi:signal transduction histidine kinase
VHQWFQRRPLAADGLLALLVFVVTLPALFIGKAPYTDPVTWLWVVAGVAPVAIRRVRLWWATGILVTLLCVSPLDERAWWGGGYSIVVVAYTIAAARPFRPAAIGTAVLWIAASLSIVGSNTTATQGTNPATLLLFNYVLAGITFAVGRAVHHRRAKVAELQDRARVAEENHAAGIIQAVNDERRRIARELHDVVAHHLSVMNVMAAGARRTLRTDPDKATDALATIEATGRTTLREMRRLLEVLRSDEEKEADDKELTPQPGLDAIHTLVKQMRDAGLPVRLIIDGEPFPLDQGVALTVFRIIQEGLTNTLKHAGPARSGVRLEFTPDALDLEVSDTGVGPASVTTGSGRVGHGLVGMRERVALYGGSLRTGPRPGGGFRIHAHIPIDASGTAVEAGGTS